MHEFEYLTAQSKEELENSIGSFYDESERPRLLEIFTPREENDKVLKAYFNNLKE